MPLGILKLITVLFAIYSFIPSYFTGFSFIALLLKLFRYGYIAGMCADFFLNFRIDKKTTVWTTLYYICLVCSTIFYSGMDASLLRSLIKTAGFTILIINFYSKYRRCLIEYLLKIIAVIGEVGAVMNFITILLFPGGLYVTAKTGEACWLYGHKNSLLLEIIIPLFASAVVFRSEKTYLPSVRTYIFAAIIVVSAILSGAGSATVCMAVLILLLLGLNVPVIRKGITMGKGICLAIILNVAIAIFRMQGMFSFLIVDILGKDLTLTTRTAIWDAALQYFRASPVLGVGYLFLGDLYKMIILSETHSYIIGILFHMGMVGVFVWCIAYILLILKSKTVKNNIIEKICAIFLFTYLIQGISENIFAPAAELKGFLILLMCYYLPFLSMERKRSVYKTGI